MRAHTHTHTHTQTHRHTAWDMWDLIDRGNDDINGRPSECWLPCYPDCNPVLFSKLKPGAYFQKEWNKQEKMKRTWKHEGFCNATADSPWVFFTIFSRSAGDSRDCSAPMTIVGEHAKLQTLGENNNAEWNAVVRETVLSSRSACHNTAPPPCARPTSPVSCSAKSNLS